MRDNIFPSTEVYNEKYPFFTEVIKFKNLLSPTTIHGLNNANSFTSGPAVLNIGSAFLLMQRNELSLSDVRVKAYL